MSTPRSLALPAHVNAVSISTSRGTFAAHRALAQGPTRGHILLIPGWTGSKEDFTPLLPLLAEAGFDVVAYDQRGQFETDGADDDDYSLAGFAIDALNVAGHAFGTERFHLLGHSFGGLVAQNVARNGPTHLASLSLLCTGPGALGPAADRPLQQFAQALQAGVDMGEVFEAKEAQNDAPAPIIAFLRQRFIANNRTSLRSMTEHLLNAPDVADEVAARGIPVWVGRGAADDAWPWDRQEAMAERLGTHVEVIADSAHSPAIENPTGLLDAWLPFLLGAS